jgi:hypothetical protein
VQVKESYGRAHWWTMTASWHAWAGAAFTILFVFTALSTLVTMPAGCKPAAIAANGPTHKVWGRILTIGLVSTVASGWCALLESVCLASGAH